MFRFRHFLLLIPPLLAVDARAATVKELFDAAARATESRGGASFRFEMTGAAPARGSAVVRGQRFRLDAEGLAVWTDGERVVVAESGMIWHSTMIRAGSPLISRYSKDVVDPYSRPARWADFLSYGPKLAGTSEIRGVRCDVAELLLPGGGGWRWHFGADDRLLRREERLRPKESIVVHYFDIQAPRGDIGAAPKGANAREFMPAGPAPGTPAPQFAVQTLDGNTFSLQARRGHVVVVDFWATWCGPCRKSMPLLQELHAKGVDVIGLTWNESGDAKAFAAKNGIGYPIADGMAVADSYGVKAYGIPVVFVIGRDGRVADFAAGWTGERGEQWLRDAVNAALRRKK